MTLDQDNIPEIDSLPKERDWLRLGVRKICLHEISSQVPANAGRALIDAPIAIAAIQAKSEAIHMCPSRRPKGLAQAFRRGAASSPHARRLADPTATSQCGGAPRSGTQTQLSRRRSGGRSRTAITLLRRQ